MPKASAPKAPWVEVWLSPQTMVMPGWVQALLGADDVDDALADVVHREISTPKSRTLRSSVSTCMRLSSSGDAAGCGRWSARCGRRRPGCGRGAGPCGRQAAGRRRPAGWSPHGPGAGRYRGRRCHPPGVDDVAVPDLVEERARFGHCFVSLISRSSRGSEFPGPRVYGICRVRLLATP